MSYPEIVWEDPAPRSKRGEVEADVGYITAALAGRPGQWARVYTGGGSGVYARRRVLTEKGYETVTRRATEGTRHLYARRVSA